MLKSQDVLVVAKLACADPADRTYPRLAASLGMSASEVHAAVQRAVTCGLVDRDSRSIRRAAVLEFFSHGLRYVFPAQREGITRGLPTAHTAPPLNSHFAQADLPPVWPHPEGTTRGEGLVPLYKSAPGAAMRDPELYEWLALLDAIRGGRARERKLATAELEKRLTT